MNNSALNGKRYGEGQRFLAIEDYNRNPRFCKECNDVLLYEYRTNIFCSSSCSVKYNNRGKPSHNGLTREREFCLNCGKRLIELESLYCNRFCKHEHEMKYKIENKIKICGKTIRNHYLKIRGLVCEQCKNTHWNDLPIPLDVHHIDGNSLNNKPENIKILCPNCHTQTDNYKSKNRKIF